MSLFVYWYLRKSKEISHTKRGNLHKIKAKSSSGILLRISHPLITQNVPHGYDFNHQVKTNERINALITDLFNTKKSSDSLVDSGKLRVNKLTCWMLCWRQNGPSPGTCSYPLSTNYSVSGDRRTDNFNINWKGYSEINPLVTEKLCRPALIQFLPHKKQNRLL
jgi:hypothetical protein